MSKLSFVFIVMPLATVPLLNTGLLNVITTAFLPSLVSSIFLLLDIFTVCLFFLASNNVNRPAAFSQGSGFQT